MGFNMMWNMRHIWVAISTDAKVRAIMNLTSATPVDIANTIIKRKVLPDQISTGQRRLAIYFTPSRPGSLEITSEIVIQIDCHIPNNVAGNIDIAHEVLENCWKAVKGKNFNGVQLEWDAILGDLYSSNSHYSTGMRLKYHNVVY